jgi:hypothetical protein
VAWCAVADRKRRFKALSRSLLTKLSNYEGLCKQKHAVVPKHVGLNLLHPVSRLKPQRLSRPSLRR